MEGGPQDNTSNTQPKGASDFLILKLCPFLLTYTDLMKFTIIAMGIYYKDIGCTLKTLQEQITEK